jgi:hypothetical protein
LDVPELEAVEDEDYLYRHVAPKPSQITKDPARDSGWRLTSANFKSHELSVDIARLTTPDRSLHGRPGHHLAQFLAGFARHACDQEVVHDPLCDNDAHALVIGDKSRTLRRQLAESCTWVVLREPPVV